MNKSSLLAILACCLVSLPVDAQRVTNLKECLEKGLEKNYSLRIVRNEEQVSKNNATPANAGMLPTVDLTAGYGGSWDNTDTKLRGGGQHTTEHNVLDHTFNANANLVWTLFDGFSISAKYDRLKELRKQGEINTRIAIEDYIAELSAEYYNYVQQKIRMKNLRYAVSLSKERLRIAEERFIIGKLSKLDLKQASVDFNADSAQCIRQNEQLTTSRIRLNELMSETDVNAFINIADSLIDVSLPLSFDDLWSATLATNASLFKAEQNKTLARLDLKAVKSRDYPYLRLNTGYGFTHNRYGVGSSEQRSNWGLNFGVTVGFKLFDGNRRRQLLNARIAAENANLEQEDLKQTLNANINTLWKAYENNRKLLQLERKNLITARENHEIARERYLLGDLPGIDMREAQKSLLDAEERILTAQYNTKICEISLLQISGKITYYVQ